jgi:hypothetical protein
MKMKRSFEELSDVEKDALQRLYEAKGVTGSGPTILARRMTGNERLRSSDEAAQVYIQLLLEHWIVVEHGSVREGAAFYKVAHDYPVLQPA